jgi:hypothetical protein
MRIGYARVSTDEQNLSLEGYSTGPVSTACLKMFVQLVWPM